MTRLFFENSTLEGFCCKFDENYGVIVKIMEWWHFMIEWRLTTAIDPAQKPDHVSIEGCASVFLYN